MNDCQRVLTGWLDPKGNLHFCGTCMHEDQAEFHHLGEKRFAKLFEEHLDNDPIDTLLTATQILEKEGWLKISGNDVREPDHVEYGETLYVSKEQFNFIKANNLSLNDDPFPDIRIK